MSRWLPELVATQLHDRVPLRRVTPEPPSALPGTWAEARTRRIDAALDQALAIDAGGWYVVGASSDIGPRSVVRRVAGTETVLWRDSTGGLRAGGGACPHLGALLDGCPVIADQVVCRWHGLPLGGRDRADWPSYPAYDDGVLAWVRLPTLGEEPSERPRLATRPDPGSSLAAVVARAGRCEPRDIIANRLDPWHGAWFHPYAFSHLTVDEARSDESRLVLDVTFQVTGRIGVPVTADFRCPDSRTIVMTILDGEGVGSVVETHATPLGIDAAGHPVTVMTEATIATSPRAGFALARRLSRVISPLVARTANRLWDDDLVYAERLYTVRARRDARD